MMRRRDQHQKRLETALSIIESRGPGGRVYLSGRTSSTAGTVHWRTAETLMRQGEVWVRRDENGPRRYATMKG
jgi:hypothetical protein